MIAFCWAALALIHLLPAVALLRPALLTTLYGVSAGSTAHLLLHHRAALFAVVVLLCAWAALRPEVRPLASVGVALSMLSFLALWHLGGMPAALRAIAVADYAGLPFLAVVVWGAWFAR